MQDEPELTGQMGTIAFPQDRTCPFHPPTGYEPLRRGEGVSRVTLYDGRDAWAVTSYAAARALLADARLSSDRRNPGFPVPSERFAGLRDTQVALLDMDGAEHRRQRQLMIPSFTVRRAAALRPWIQRTVDELLDVMIEQGSPADLVTSFALPVPSMVICGLLGVPYADHEFFDEQSRKLLRGLHAKDSQDALASLSQYLGELIDNKAKRTESGEGILDEFAQLLRDGTGNRDELVSLAFILLIAGHETTANMIALGVYTLLQHPDELSTLRADLTLLPSVVEELMRMLSIVDGLQRVAIEDIEIAGITIRAGEGVLFSTSLINRDGSVYDNPDTLDLLRADRHHLAFGFGIHQCLGQNLARVELEIALSGLLTRTPGLRLAIPVEEIRILRGDGFQGILELPVAW
ncbi:cytochrome P450 [Streptomyces sp. NPDC086783]|uniref:cytochrome P450 n=1 Tax=Streptomyces sp. NPDC086783 TaxID=3365758 RepID=UPI003800B8B9